MRGHAGFALFFAFNYAVVHLTNQMDMGKRDANLALKRSLPFIAGVAGLVRLGGPIHPTLWAEMTLCPSSVILLATKWYTKREGSRLSQK